MEQKYRPTLCKFQSTNYIDKTLYALDTVLVNIYNPIDKVQLFIRFGDNLSYVKQIARGIYEGNDMSLFLRKELYRHNIPFFEKEGNFVRCDSSGKPIHFDEKQYNRVGYYNDYGKFVYLGYKQITDEFDYDVRRGTIVLAEKNGNEWCLPHNIDQHLIKKYPTQEIPIEALLK